MKGIADQLLTQDSTGDDCACDVGKFVPFRLPAYLWMDTKDKHGCIITVTLKT